MSDAVVPVSPERAKRAWVDAAKYQAMYRRSVDDPEGFWADEAKRILHERQPAMLVTEDLDEAMRRIDEIVAGTGA